jgi:hypothetical protein
MSLYIRHLNRASRAAYWPSSVAIALAMAFGGLVDLLHHPFADRTMTQLGFPPNFQLILGTWKLLAVAALFWPGLPRLKEWAYAGIVFDVTGAFVAHAVCGDSFALIAPLVVLGLTLCSWACRPANRRLRAPCAAWKLLDGDA